MSRVARIPGFEIAMAAGAVGMVAYRVLLAVLPHYEGLLSFVALAGGLLTLSGACEFLVRSVEGLSARMQWDQYIGGTIAEIVSTFPDLVVIILVVLVSPLTSFTLALMTVYNNALVFSIYSYFLPKDHKGRYVMPRPVTVAGTEVMIAGAGLALVYGLVMLALRSETHKTYLSPPDLFFVGAVMLCIFGWYMHTLVKYYSAGEKAGSDGARERHGAEYATWRHIVTFGMIGVIGSLLGGEAISRFAEASIKDLGLRPMQTALVLACFGGLSEYVIVYKAHKRKEFGIALSTVFGGITQVMFLVFPFTLLVIGVAMLSGVSPDVIPINFVTTVLMCLLFPVFFVLFELIEKDHTLNNLDATAMTGIYLVVIYVLVSYGPM